MLNDSTSKSLASFSVIYHEYSCGHDKDKRAMYANE